MPQSSKTPRLLSLSCVFSSSLYSAFFILVVSVSCWVVSDSLRLLCPGSFGPGILQARILEWVAISFSRGSSLLHICIYTSPCCLTICSSSIPSPIIQPDSIPFVLALPCHSLMCWVNTLKIPISSHAAYSSFNLLYPGLCSHQSQLVQNVLRVFVAKSNKLLACSCLPWPLSRIWYFWLLPS